MNDLEIVFREAWQRIAPMLKNNPDELAARLARRRSLTYLRPMRSMCLAVRAADQRINLTSAIIIPEHAFELNCEWHPGRMIDHQVVLDARLLRQICQPITLLPPCETYDAVARKLGCHKFNLKRMRKNGSFHEHGIKGLMGRRGHPVPLLYTRELLDPTALNRARPDPIFGGLWAFFADSLPEDFSHTVTRVAKDPYLPSQRDRGFGGWRWLCPGCRQLKKTLYYPRAVPDWGEYLRERRLLDLPIPKEGPDAVAPPNPTFACARCHQVQFFSRTHLADAWNKLILRYSGGLLYGHEVRQPDGFTKLRKKEFHRRPVRNQPFRDQLLRLLVTTHWTRAQIAKELGVNWMTVHNNAKDILKRSDIPPQDFPAARQQLRHLHPHMMPKETKQAG